MNLLNKLTFNDCSPTSDLGSSGNSVSPASKSRWDQAMAEAESGGGSDGGWSGAGGQASNFANWNGPAEDRPATALAGGIALPTGGAALAESIEARAGLAVAERFVATALGGTAAGGGITLLFWPASTARNDTMSGSGVASRLSRLNGAQVIHTSSGELADARLDPTLNAQMLQAMQGGMPAAGVGQAISGATRVDLGIRAASSSGMAGARGLSLAGILQFQCSPSCSM